MINKYYLVLLSLFLIVAVIYALARKSNNIERFSDNLEGKNILITAATNGIGLELSKVLAKRNTRLFVTGRRADKTIELVEELNKLNTNVWGKHADFTDDKETTSMWKEAVKNLGTIDIVIHLPIKSYTRMKLMKTDKSSFNDLNKKNFDRVMHINQLAVDHMKSKKLAGRIIVSSSAKAEVNTTKLTHGSEILMNSQIERYTDLLSRELEGYGIAVCCVRIDRDTSNSLINYKLPIKPNKLAEKLLKPLDKIPKLFGRDPKKIVGVYMECLKLNISELNGKIFSTETFIRDKKLAPYVSPDILQRNLDHSFYLVENDKLDRTNKNQVFLNKQIDFKLPNSIKKILNGDSINTLVSGVNSHNKYSGELPSILAEHCGVASNTIEVFNSEYDAMRKIFEIFTSNRDTICSEEPTCPQLTSIIKDRGHDRTFVDFKIDKNTRQIEIDSKKLDKNLTGAVKMLWLSSPGLVTGVSINESKFKEIMMKVSSRTIVVVDQRLLECSFKKKAFDASKYINKYKNLIVLRSMNNFYSIESLKIAYTITNLEVIKILNEKNLINQIDSLNERMAIKVIGDKKYKTEAKETIRKENEFMTSRLNDSNVKFINSDTHLILVDTYRPKKDIIEDLENENVLFYRSNDEISNYWTLPISMRREVNQKITSVINYSV